MICPYCGKENPDDIDICGFCGGPLTPSEQEAEPYTPEPKVTIIQSSAKVEIPQTETIVPPPQSPRGISGNRIWWLVGCFVLVLLFLCCAVGTLAVYRYINRLATSLPEAIPTTLSRIPIETMPIEVIPTTSDPTEVIPIATVPTTSSQGQLLYDDFSDPNSGWDRVDTGDYYTDYYSDSYRIVVYSDMSDSWANPDHNIFNDVSIEVEATKNGGPDDNDYGVICRYQNMNQFYYGVISSDGYYGITKVTSDSSTRLGGEDMGYSNYINQGAATNYIRFDCKGDVLSLYVNGQLVDEQTDSEYTSGNVGLIAGTYDTAGTDILFDNYSVLQP
jgi:hypothetical protein